MSTTNLSFSQILDDARQVLPKLSNSPQLAAKGKVLAESLQYYADLLNNGNTTAVDLGSGTEKLLKEIAEEVGQIAVELAPDIPEVRKVLEKIGYYDD
jgi:hypothetical protein